MKVRFGAAQLRLAFLPPMINPNQKKMNAHNEKDQQCRTSKKDGKLSATFSSINEAFAVVQKYLADNVFVCYYPPVSRKCDSVDQSTDGMRSSNLPAPFQALIRTPVLFNFIPCISMRRTVTSIPIRFNTCIVTPLVSE